MTIVPRALALTGDETGCSMWRVWAPFAELARQGWIADYAPVHGCPRCALASRPEELRGNDAPPWRCPECGYISFAPESMSRAVDIINTGRYNMIVTPRIVWPRDGNGDFWIRTIHKAGIAWIYEVDDDVYSPNIINRQMRLFESEARKGEKQLEWQRQERIRFLGLCDGVTVSSQRLATIVRRYAPPNLPVMVVPNVIAADCGRARNLDIEAAIAQVNGEVVNDVGCCWKHWLWEGRRLPQLEGKLTIGWAGGTREDADLAPLIEAWGIIAERYPDVQFVVQGHISQALADAVPEDRRVTLPWLPLPEYPRGLLNIDIGCCSVAPLVFNTAKTCIKWYEMTLAGAVCVVSPTLYGREVVDGETALVAESAEQWVAQLSRLVEDEQLRRTLQRNARRVVMTEHSLENNWMNWPLAWASMLEQFHEKRARRLVLAS